MPRRIRRSVLFTPGTQLDRVAKVLAAGAADSVVIDWEDAVAPAEKAKAREATKAAWADLPKSRTERVIRVNAIGTEWHRADVDAAVALAPDAIMVPKAEDPALLAQLVDDMWRIETEHSIRQLQTKLLFILETGRGIENALAIADAAPQRLEALIFGAEDYQVDVGGRRRRDNLDVLYARSRVVAAAAAARLHAIDQVFVDYKDATGLKFEADFARDLGYRGKMVIHPDQVPVVNEAFTPTVAEIQRAARVLEAAALAEKEGRGAFGLDGKMVDRPVIEQARLVMEIARAAGKIA